jgi:tagatose 6-phosphate kinase
VIAVVCLNPALDVTHHVPAVDWAGVNRPTEVHARPGGKGLNVARTLHALGADVLVLGLTGGITGAGVAAALGELGIPAAFTETAHETRRTFTVVDAHRTALFSEPGPAVSSREFAAFRACYQRTLEQAEAVVLSGSLPPGLPDDTYATLIALARNVPAILDAHGEPLRLGATAQPAVVKPNRPELESLTGHPLPTPAAVTAAAAQLRHTGAQAVVTTLGPDGLLAATGHGHWHARPAPVKGNATGAGDAVAAALAHGLVLGRPWPERLRHAAALGAATAAAPAAGEFSPADYANALATVTVHEVPRCP